MTFQVVAISGSLRKSSTNTMALRAAQRLAQPGEHRRIGLAGKIDIDQRGQGDVVAHRAA